MPESHDLCVASHTSAQRRLLSLTITRASQSGWRVVVNGIATTIDRAMDGVWYVMSERNRWMQLGNSRSAAIRTLLHIYSTGE